jgi:hypothetical protein
MYNAVNKRVDGFSHTYMAFNENLVSTLNSVTRKLGQGTSIVIFLTLFGHHPSNLELAWQERNGKRILLDVTLQWGALRVS